MIKFSARSPLSGIFLFLFFILIFPGAEKKAFALEPKSMDPLDILSYPVESWRDRRFELFRWDRFPEILIFDTASFAVQNRFFHRLAFFVEKAGFRGRLSPDAEITGLHGWNAHNYRAEDLANFFETARRTNFPLLPEERELQSILFTGIRQKSSFTLHGSRGIPRPFLY
jgi:hypothetical protein